MRPDALLPFCAGNRVGLSANDDISFGHVRALSTDQCSVLVAAIAARTSAMAVPNACDASSASASSSVPAHAMHPDPSRVAPDHVERLSFRVNDTRHSILLAQRIDTVLQPGQCLIKRFRGCLQIFHGALLGPQYGRITINIANSKRNANCTLDAEQGCKVDRRDSANGDFYMQFDQSALKDMANAIRALSMDAVEKAASGHVGMPLGMADVATTLFTSHLNYDPQKPDWKDRDRFVLSAGHGSMLIYSLLHLTGYESVSLSDIENFRQLGAQTPGHPENFITQGVETTTGPLGQGIATAVGMALAERHLNARFGDDLVDHYTYVLAGDGCLMEGVSQEAITLAGHLNLNRMIVLWDDNSVTIDGGTDMSDSTDQIKRFEAAGWMTAAIDGHDPEAIDQALTWAKSCDKPVMIACKTRIGYGAPNIEGTGKAHGGPYGAEEIAGIRKYIGWDHEPFVLPESVVANWRAAGARGRKRAKPGKSALPGLRNEMLLKAFTTQNCASLR